MAVAPIRPREPLRAVRSPNDDAQAREVGAMVIDAVNALSARVNAIDEDVLDTKVEVFRIARHLKLSPPETEPPPMRGKLGSLHDTAEEVARGVSRKYAEDQANTSTPPPSPRDVEAMVLDRVRIALEARDAAKWRQLEEERKDNETERLALQKLNRRDRRKALWRLVGVSLLALGALVTALAEHFGR